MKIIFTFLFTLAVIYTVHAQSFEGGLKAGMTVSQVAGDGFSGFHKAGFYAGGWVALKLKPTMSLQMDLAYIQKGSAQQADETLAVPQYLLRLNYVELPLVVQYHIDRITVEAGLSFDFLAGQKETINHLDNDQGAVWRKMNLASVIGLRYRLTDRWLVSLRSTNSINSIRTNSVPLNVRRYGRNFGAFNDALAIGFMIQL